MGHVCCAMGDVHGHLQLALGIAARWQLGLGRDFDAVLLWGDKIEFLTQWMDPASAPWLEGIFRPVSEGGLGLACPVVMVHGNHEGFEHPERLVEMASFMLTTVN